MAHDPRDSPPLRYNDASPQTDEARNLSAADRRDDYDAAPSYAERERERDRPRSREFLDSHDDRSADRDHERSHDDRRYHDDNDRAHYDHRQLSDDHEVDRHRRDSTDRFNHHDSDIHRDNRVLSDRRDRDDREHPGHSDDRDQLDADPRGNHDDRLLDHPHDDRSIPGDHSAHPRSDRPDPTVSDPSDTHGGTGAQPDERHPPDLDTDPANHTNHQPADHDRTLVNLFVRNVAKHVMEQQLIDLFSKVCNDYLQLFSLYVHLPSVHFSRYSAIQIYYFFHLSSVFLMSTYIYSPVP